MQNKLIQTILAETPKEVELFVDKYTDIVLRINQILTEKGLTQGKLAENMGKNPSEISKWLNDEHNLTLRTICKLEAELGETLLEVPTRKPLPNIMVAHKTVTYTMYINNVPPKDDTKYPDGFDYPKLRIAK